VSPHAHPNLDEWHHWAFTYDGETNERRLYRDGVLVVEKPSPKDYIGRGRTYIGRPPWGHDFFHGAIDDVRIYSRALSGPEVGELHRIEKHGEASAAASRAEASLATPPSPAGLDPERARVMARLWADDEQTRSATVAALREEGYDFLLGDLISGALRGKDAAERRTYRWNLAQKTHPDVLPTMLVALADSAPVVRAGAAEVLGRMGGERAAKALIVTAATADAPEVRGAAVTGLGRIGGEAVVGPLIAELDGPAARSAVWALSEVGGSRAIEALAATAKEGRKGLRSSAVSALSEMGDPRSLLALIPVMLNDPDDRLRASAARALSKKPEPDFADPFLAALDDKDFVVRMSAAKGLGETGDERAIHPLVVLLTDRAGGDAARALDKLGWQPESRTDKIRYAVATGDWYEAERLADLLPPNKENANRVEGRIEFGTPALLGLEAFTGTAAGPARGIPRRSIPWVEFQEDDGAVHAAVELGCWSFLASWRVTMDLLDRAGQVVDSQEQIFSSSGTVITVAHWEEHLVDFSLAGTEGVADAERFVLTVEPIATVPPRL